MVTVEDPALAFDSEHTFDVMKRSFSTIIVKCKQHLFHQLSLTANEISAIKSYKNKQVILHYRE